MAPFETMSSLESTALRPDQRAASNIIGLPEGFTSSERPRFGFFDGANAAFDESVAQAVGIENPSMLSGLHPTIRECTKQMLDGTIDDMGNRTLCLRDISEWKLGDYPYREMNIKQQAGYTAEVISTAKENILATSEKSGIKTYRADDRPDLGFKKNDQYVDKIRVNDAGEVVERVQTKFFGKNGDDWVSKMMSKKCEKYLDGSHVDKLECPSDYYSDAKASITKQLDGLNRQLERVTAEGKEGAAESIQHKIDKLNKIDEMIEKSLVSSDEAVYARNHPQRYAMKTFAADTLKMSGKEGLKGGAFAAGLTFVVSTSKHGGEFLDGEISAEEMLSSIAAETGAAGAAGGLGSFVSTTISNTMQSSSHGLIRSVGGSCLPAAFVAFGVESYDSISDFSQGVIGPEELAYDLGENAAAVAGGTLAGAKAGALAGSVLGPGGAVVGGVVGGVVGTAVASGAYKTAVEYAPGMANEAAKQVEHCANTAMDVITEQFPEQVDNARTSFNDFFESNNIPVRI